MNKITTSQYSEKAIQAYYKTGLPTETFRCEASSDAVTITMYDIIGSDSCNENSFADALKQANGAPVTIHLSSPGGSVFEGYNMYNNLKNYAGDTTVIVDGVCASIASVLALGADVVKTQEQSLWMIHNAWTVSVGDAAEMRKTADTLDKCNQNLIAIYASKTGTDAATWAERMTEETWYTAEEALAAKLVDVIHVAPKKTKVEPTDRTINEIRAEQRLDPIEPQAQVYDPDQDGDDDAAECVGLLNSAMLLLNEAIETLTATPDSPDDDMQNAASELQRQLRVRRAMIAAIGLEIENDQMAAALINTN